MASLDNAYGTRITPSHGPVADGGDDLAFPLCFSYAARPFEIPHLPALLA